MNSESKPSAKARWREFFLLEQRLADARREQFRPSHPGWAEFMLGRTALADADQLAQGSDSASSALLLYRAALVLLASALRARPAAHLAAPEGEEPPLRLPAEQEAIASLPEGQRAIVQEAMGANSPEQHLAKLSDAQRRQALKGMQQVARTLVDSLETQANRAKWLARQRWVRAGVPAILAVWLIAWTGNEIFARPNLALDKSVTLSSSYQGRTFPRERVVDGDRSNLGFHTACASNQWVSIDLGRVETIRTVDVYNRSDCCQSRAKPLNLEVSTDGEQFTSVARRTAEFDEWNAELPPTQARFIRVTNESDNCLHLSEIEVY